MRLKQLHEGYKVLPPIDKERYTDIPGMEGPFRTLSGAVVYYDPKEGAYYSRDTDMYLSYDEFRKLDNDYSNMKEDHSSDTMVCKHCGDHMGKPTTDCECDCNDENGDHWIEEEVESVEEAYISKTSDAVNVLANLRKIGKSIERGQQPGYEGNLANMYATDVWDVYQWIESKTKGFNNIDKNFMSAVDEMMNLRSEAKKLETTPGSGSNARFGNQIVTVLYPVMQYIERDITDSVKEDAEQDKAQYAIIRYPDTAISYIKNDGNGWVHIYDKSYGFKGPVDKADLKHANKIAKEKIPSRMLGESPFKSKPNELGSGRSKVEPGSAHDDMRRNILNRNDRLSHQANAIPEPGDRAKAGLGSQFQAQAKPGGKIPKGLWQAALMALAPTKMGDGEMQPDTIAKIDRLNALKSKRKPSSDLGEGSIAGTVRRVRDMVTNGASKMDVKRMFPHMSDDTITGFFERFGLSEAPSVADRFKAAAERGEAEHAKRKPAMDLALARIDATFSPERRAITDQISAMVRAVTMLADPRWASRAWSNVEAYGITDAESLKQEMTIMLANEKKLIDDDLIGMSAQTSVTALERALAKL